MLIYRSKRYLTNGMMSGNPTKKMRLDFQNNIGGNTGNEDLWGQDDLTAEEFDMLEIQATQSCKQINQTSVHNNFCDLENNVSEENDLKQHQYELEGRVKLLSQSLEKSVKELSEERISREQIIKDRMKEFYERESNLQKEIEKMRSILEFKDQEMKSTYSKLQVLRSQAKDKKNSSAETSINKNFTDFLKSSKSDPFANSTNSETSERFCRRHKLSIDCPKGETKSIDILSSLLCTRLTIPSFPSSGSILNSVNLEDHYCNSDFTSLSVVQLKNEQRCDELLEHYKCILKNHISHVKSLASKSSGTNSGKNSPTAVQKEVASCSVISCLRDISYLLSCPMFKPQLKKCTVESKNNPTTSVDNIQVAKDLASEHMPYNKDNNELLVCTLTEILESLLVLTDPKTYPPGYSKTEEIEYSLAALLSICLSYPEILLEMDCGLPIHSFLNPHQSVTGLCISIKLLITLCHHEKFALCLTHKDSNCILCLIGAFLINVVPYYPGKFSSSVILVENFLSSIFSIHDITEIRLETSDCISEVIQGIIKSIWQYYCLKENCNSRIQIIKKGILLLHTLSNCLPNFKEKRSLVEDEYILLVTSIVATSKETVEFRDFYDLMHTLWDFQTDNTEFDMDEFSEEMQASANEMDFTE